MDALGTYLKELESIPLLTPAEELALAKRVWNGRNKLHRPHVDRKANPITYNPLLGMTPDAAEAATLLVHHNLRLVVFFAKKYANEHHSMEDLISEGTFGLYAAARKFDYRKGWRFSTYASNWIKQFMFRERARHQGAVHVPIHQVVLAKGAHRNLHAADAMKATISLSPAPLDDIEGLVETNKSTLIEPYANVADPHDVIAHQESLLDLEVNLFKLPEKERLAITHCFGLFGESKKTMDETSAHLGWGVTRERVRQIMEKGLGRLREHYGVSQKRQIAKGMKRPRYVA